MFRTSLLTVLLLVMATFAYAGTTGNLTGKITEQDNGTALTDAHITLFQNAVKKAAANSRSDGTYTAINVAPGTYDVQVRRSGYETRVVHGVEIMVDETTRQDVELAVQGHKLPDITVTHETKLHQTGGSGKTMDSNAIDNTPVTSITELVSRQAGVINEGGELHVRGGRANEVVFTVDGATVTNPFSGGSHLTVDLDAVETINSITGGLPAEYGNAQSGVFNVVTKDGGPVFSGKIEAQSDHLFGDGNNEDIAKLMLSGPVMFWLGNSEKEMELRNKFTFFFNGSGDWSDSRFKKYYGGDPNKVFSLNGASLLANDYPNYDQYAGRDSFLGFDIGDRNYNTYSYNLKTAYSIDSRRKVTLAVRGDRDKNEPFSYLWRFADDHYLEVENNQSQYLGTFDYNFGKENNMNLKVKANYYERTSKYHPRGLNKHSYFVKDENLFDPENGDYGYYKLDSNEDGVIDTYPYTDVWEYRLSGTGETRAVEGFAVPGSMYGAISENTIKQYQLKSDYEVSINQLHTLKAGIELIQHDIKQDNLTSPYQVDDQRFDDYLLQKRTGNPGAVSDTTYASDGSYYQVNYQGGSLQYARYYAGHDEPFYVYQPDVYYNAVYATSGTYDGYNAKPFQAAWYLQDKMNVEGLLVNAGARFDLWYLGKRYKIRDTDGTYQYSYFDKKDRMQLMISPRLSISHPISENDVMHFSYNYQNQLPQMQYIFTSTSESQAVNNTNIIIGNPALDPQITITYEVGLEHRINDTWSLDVAAYYKNLYNYVSTVKKTLDGNDVVYYYQYISQNWGSCKGIDLNLTKEVSHYLSGSASYSLAWASGNNSADGEEQDENNNLREYPLDWDVRHTFNLNTTFQLNENDPFLGTTYLSKWGEFTTSFQYTISSGLPYTPYTSTDGTSTNLSPDINSKRMPYTETTTLSFRKEIVLSHAKVLANNSKTTPKLMRFQLNIDNLFNRHNVYDVYPRTGKAFDDGADLSTGSNNYIYEERVYMHKLAISDPTRESGDRTFTFTVSYNW